MKKFASAGPLGLILCLVLISAGASYWAHRVHEQERLYRESSIQKLAELGRQWADIHSTRFQMEIGPLEMFEDGLQTRTGFSGGKASEELDRQEAQVRANFALLEKTIRNSNRGALPDWVKENPNYRELQQAFAQVTQR